MDKNSYIEVRKELSGWGCNGHPDDSKDDQLLHIIRIRQSEIRLCKECTINLINKLQEE